MTQTPTPPPAAPLAAIQARRAERAAKVKRVEDALKRMGRQGLPISRAGVAKTAGVSRTFVYECEEARTAIDAAIARSNSRADARPSEVTNAEAASWRQRALNAEEALKLARQEAASQRSMIADLLGQLRDPDGTSLLEDRALLRTENEKIRAEREELRRRLTELERSLEASRAHVRRLRGNNVTTLFPNGPGPDKRPHPRQVHNEESQ